MTLSILFLASSGRQGSILTYTRRWQCRSILERFVENTGQLNFHLFSGSLLGYLDLPPSSSSLIEGNTESLFSRSRSLKFAINNNNMGEGLWGTSCFLCIGWKPAASHTFLVILAHFGVGRGMGSPPSNKSKFSHNRLLPGQETRALCRVLPPRQALFHSPPLVKFSKHSLFRFLFSSHITKSGAEWDTLPRAPP